MELRSLGRFILPSWCEFGVEKLESETRLQGGGQLDLPARYYSLQ